jgi:hypothetical protein
MELSIEIETFDNMLAFDLFDVTRISDKTEKSITEGISVRYESTLIRKAEGFPEIVNIALFIGEHVALPIAVSIVSRWLYDKLKKRKDNRLTINNTSVEINAEKIEQLIINILKEKKDE